MYSVRVLSVLCRHHPPRRPDILGLRGDFRFYKADANLDVVSTAFQPELRTTATSSFHEQYENSTELDVSSSEINSSQLWEDTSGLRGYQRVHDFFYIYHVRLSHGGCSVAWLEHVN